MLPDTHNKVPAILLLAVMVAFLFTAAAGCAGGPQADGICSAEPQAAAGNPGTVAAEDPSWQQKGMPDDRYLAKQWSYQSFGGMTGEDSDGQVLVAVLDTGIASVHEDIIGKVIGEVNFTESFTTSDLRGHGTQIAGIIGAHVNNSLGIAGLAPHARLLNVKVADDTGRVWPADMASGIIWAADHGARVINVSLCLGNGSQALEEAVEYAWKKGAVIVAAAGNCQMQAQAPACYPHVIAVGALDASYGIWQRSNQGECVNAYAPGVDIYSTLPGNSYGYISGTSAAAAYVSAAAAEMLTYTADVNGNGYVNDEVFQQITSKFDL